MEKRYSGTVSGMLLYAKTDEEIFPDSGAVKSFISTGNSIGVGTLDLNNDFPLIERQLKSIAEKYFDC